MNPLPFLALLKNPWVLLVIACVLGVGGTGWYRMQYESEKAGRVSDALAAQQAANKKIAEAKVESDAAIAALQDRLGLQTSATIALVDRIKHDTPASTSCPPSPAARDASRGVGSLLRTNPNSTGGPAAK